jgi:hypothetical protein
LSAVALADFEHIAKAARGDQRYFRAAALEDRVGCDRGAMRDLADLREIHTELADAIGHSLGSDRGVSTAPFR